MELLKRRLHFAELCFRLTSCHSSANADAGSCVGYQTGTVCDRYIASGQTQYYDLGSAINMSKIPDIFSQIESFGLCKFVDFITSNLPASF